MIDWTVSVLMDVLVVYGWKGDYSRYVAHSFDVIRGYFFDVSCDGACVKGWRGRE